MKNRILLPLVIIASLLVGFSGGIFYLRSSAPIPSVVGNLINRNANQPKDVDFSEFWNVWSIMHSDFVDKSKINDRDLVYGAIDGLVNSLGDPYTVFFKPKESQQFAQQINGSFGGVGIEIGLRSGVITVITPIKGTPAEKAGIMAGDKIIKIGDKSTSEMKIDDAVNLIRGPKGTPVRLTYLRTGAKEGKEVTILRDAIKVPTIDWKLVDDHTAYVQLYIFNKNVDAEFDRVAKEITKSKADRIILDLRNNPGGLLDSAVNISSYFLDADKVVTSERSGDGKQNSSFTTRPNGILKNYPLVVIVNKGSASASEILSGALKDNRGVTIVGETSFGKGSVQEVRELSAGASLKITIAKWFTPKGNSISDHGITPDVEVKRTEEDFNADRDPQLDKAKELVRNLK